MRCCNSKEEKLIEQINILKKSKEIEKIIDEIKQNVIKNGAYIVRNRIKTETSALESLRTNKIGMNVSKNIYKSVILTSSDIIKSFESVETIVDLLAIRIVTNTIDEMYKVMDCLKKLYEPYLIMDHLKKPIIGFEYRAIHMYFKIELADVDFEIPMEIQIKTYEMHYAWEALHDTIYKNMTINLRDGCTLLPILFKIFEFNAKVCKGYYLRECEQLDFSAIDALIDYNKPIFEKYKLEIEKSCLLFARSICLDMNSEMNINGKFLEKEFERIKKCTKIEDQELLHICGDKNLEYATYCIATNRMGEKIDYSI